MKTVSPALRAHEVDRDAPLYIVLNRGSGHHAEGDVRLVIESALASAGRTFSLHEVSDPAELKSLANAVVAEARRSRGIVVAAGGDGTINVVAEATLGSGCPFGVVPLGTFNYFSRSHGIPSEVPAACRVLLAARAFEVQVGLVNERVFLVNSSIGLYPDLLEDRERAKRQLGRSRPVALAAALASLLRPHRALRIDVQAQPGRHSLVTPTLFVGNNRLQLQRVGIAGSELLERHRLVAVVLEPVGWLGMLWLVVRALFGRLGEADAVSSFQFERLTVRTRLGRRRFKVATDGEVEMLSSPLTFSIAAHPLLLLRPADAGEDPG